MDLLCTAGDQVQKTAACQGRRRLRTGPSNA